MDNKFHKFYLKTPKKRLEILKESGYIEDLERPILEDNISNVMIENFLLNYQLPLGLGLNFIVDGQGVLIPMVIEEPSVVAAASNGAKILGNIQSEILEKAVVGQIVLYDIKDVDKALKLVERNQVDLLELAGNYCQSMINRGGGPRKVWAEKYSDDKQTYMSVYFSVDTCDAMGANTINTILESISDYIEDMLEAKSLMRIISNNSTESLVIAKSRINIDRLSHNPDEAREIAKRIDMAQKYASLDVYRASTHNKGIMNGIDAVVLATGNDWRAIEAAVHTFASRDGKYKSLTDWNYLEDEGILEGIIELPLPVATLGGTISVHPHAKWSLKLMGNPSAKRLASIMAAVGLAQNFAALRALVTDGIQKGHMSLHARSVAKQVGASETEIERVVELLKKEKKINSDTALNILNKIRKES